MPKHPKGGKNGTNGQPSGTPDAVTGTSVTPEQAAAAAAAAEASHRVPEVPSEFPGIPPPGSPAVAPDLDRMEMTQLLRLMQQQEARRYEEEQRRREDDARREELRQQEFQALLAAFANRPPAPASPTPPTHTQTVSTTAPTPKRAPVELPKRKLAPDASYAVYKAWRRDWDDFVIVSKIESAPQPEQLAYLRQALTSDMKEHLKHNLGIHEDSNQSLADVLQGIETYIKSLSGPALRRFKFHQCRQKDGETFDSFYTRVRQLAADADVISCNDCNKCVKCLEVPVIDAIIIGTNDEELRTELLTKRPDTKLEEYVAFARSFLTARKTSMELKKPNDVSAISAYRKAKKKDSIPATNTISAHKVETEPPPVSHSKKPVCIHCKKKGHISDSCWIKYPHKRPKKAHVAADVSSIHSVLDDPAKVNEVTEGMSAPTPKMKATVNVGHLASHIEFTADTGARVTTMSVKDMKSLGLTVKDLRPPRRPLQAANKSTIECLGTFSARITFQGRETHTTVYVCKQVDTLMSFADLKRLHVIHDRFPHPLPHPIDISAVADIEPPSSDRPPAEIKKWFLSEFADVLITKDRAESHLPIMTGPPMKIELMEDAKPFKLYNARVIPLAWQQPTKQALDNLVSLGVIEPVGDVISDWVHPIVVVPKSKGGIRITTDFSKLNAYVKRPVHPTDTPELAISKIKPGTKFISTFDCLHGYHQVEVHESSRHLLHFITPFGKYTYKRCPMGLVSSGDEFSRRVDEALAGLENMSKVMDDLLLHDATYEEHIKRVLQLLLRCRKHRITLNADKFVFAEPEVHWVGYKINETGRTPTEDKIRAIKDFPPPANITDLRSFMGLVNQLASFSEEIASLAQPLRPLLSVKRSFLWTEEQQKAFEAVKQALSEPPILAHFDPTLPTALHTDAAKLFGLGFALMQRHGDTWKLVKCGSRYLNSAESTSYSIIELELTAIVWALKKCRYFLLGLHKFEVVTDHKSLVPILNNYTLDNVETFRLLKLKEKTGDFVFKAVWRKGKEHAIPDALSRRPVDQPTAEDDVLSEESVMFIRTISDVGGKDPLIDEMDKAAAEDPVYQELKQFLLTSNEDSRRNVPETIRSYTKQLDELSCEGNLVLRGMRILVPSSLRRKVLANLHSSHTGAEAAKRRARQSLWWPGMNSDITSTVQACEECQIRRSSHPPEPLESDSTPSWPFEEASADLFALSGKTYLCYADRLSGWATPCSYGKDTSTSATIKILRELFRNLGVPRRLRTDGGPQFSSAEFREFTKSWGIQHDMTSPHMPNSNGHAEAHVKALKNLLGKTTQKGNLNTDEFTKGLLELRNTPRADGLSPAQILYGRTLRSCLPSHRRLFAPTWLSKIAEWDAKRAATKAKVKRAYDRHAKSLEPLAIEDEVRIQDPTTKKWDRTGTVVEIRPNRSYEVKLPSGRLLWRNRRYLAKIPATISD